MASVSQAAAIPFQNENYYEKISIRSKKLLNGFG
jgi:hypothetical protein